MAGGRGSRLHELTDYRSKPALFFGGKFRMIDFPLSNCVNSGVRRIGVLTQYKAHSLIDHLVKGWSQFRSDLGEFVQILPASQQTHGDWYAGTADAVFQNLDTIRSLQPKYTLILSGDHIYKMDFGTILAQHVATGADVTISCIPVPVETAAGAYGVMTTDSENRVLAFDEKPDCPAPLDGNPGYTLASMGNYVFNTEFLIDQLIKDAEDSDSVHDFGKSILPSLVKSNHVFAFSFDDEETGAPAYWRDIGTLDAYWEANMDLVSMTPELNLYDRDWPILTYQPQLAPAKFIFDQDMRRGNALDSIVSGGCIISGARLKNSVLFYDVTAHSYSSVSESVVLPEVNIGRHCRIHKAIIDRGCNIPANTEIGIDNRLDRLRGFRVTERDVVLVTPKMLDQNMRHIPDRRVRHKNQDFDGCERRHAKSGIRYA
jgi:glucose-1-phosphate adenylyltransferase